MSKLISMLTILYMKLYRNEVDHKNIDMWWSMYLLESVNWYVRSSYLLYTY